MRQKGKQGQLTKKSTEEIFNNMKQRKNIIKQKKSPDVNKDMNVRKVDCKDMAHDNLVPDQRETLTLYTDEGKATQMETIRGYENTEDKLQKLHETATVGILFSCLPNN